MKGAIEKFHLQRFLVEFLVETKVMFICYFLYVTRLRSQLFSRHYYKDKDQDYISDVWSAQNKICSLNFSNCVDRNAAIRVSCNFSETLNVF